MTRSPDPSPSRTGAPSVRGGAQIALAVGVMNVATYAYTILAARVLGPGGYGAFAAVMNLLLVIGVVPLALQATAARRISADPERVGQIETSTMRVTVRTAGVLGVALLVLSPAVDRLLRLDDLRMAALVALAAVPLTLMGGQAGILQGERRWAPLAWVYVAGGVPRLALGTALLWWQPSELSAVAAVAVANVAPAVVGWWALRGDRPHGPTDPTHDGRAVVRESVLNSQALLAFFALSNLDVVVARNVLDAHASGLYAAGLILAKAMLFLPQFVVVLAFPAMAVSARSRALAGGVALISTLGGIGVLLTWWLPDLALVFVGGDDFAGIGDRLWLFALLGTVLAVLQLLVYAVLSREGRGGSLLLWLGLVAMLAVGAGADSAADLAVRVVVVDALVLAGLLLSARADRRSGVPA